MSKVIGVRFKKAGRVCYYSPGNLSVAKGDDVIAETARGLEYGQVVTEIKEVGEDFDLTALKVVQRKATESDRRRLEENKEKEKEAFKLCEEKIAFRRLPMKLINVEYTFDVSKIVFYFTADGRIDFRELVKDLAAIFRTRIELRQIGVRDEARLLGGIGYCGRALCCASFLGEFEPVSIRMAKGQNLSLNPTKISGICGRLMCCLKFENDCYDEECPQKQVIEPPTAGKRVVSEYGEGKVISVNLQRRNTTILLDDNKTIVCGWDEVVEKEEEETPPPSPKRHQPREERRERRAPGSKRDDGRTGKHAHRRRDESRNPNSKKPRGERQPRSGKNRGSK